MAANGSDSSSQSSDEELYEIVRIIRPRVYRERYNPFEV